MQTTGVSLKETVFGVLRTLISERGLRFEATTTEIRERIPADDQPSQSAVYQIVQKAAEEGFFRLVKNGQGKPLGYDFRRSVMFNPELVTTTTDADQPTTVTAVSDPEAIQSVQETLDRILERYHQLVEERTRLLAEIQTKDRLLALYGDATRQMEVA